MAIERELSSESGESGRAIDIWGLVLRHLVLIGFTTAVGAGLGYLYFMKTPPTYRSACSLHVRDDSANQGIPFQGNDGVAQMPRAQPHALLIISPLVIDRALDKKMGEGLSEKDSGRRLRDLPALASLDNPRGYIINRLTAKPSVNGGAESHDIIDLKYRDSDALTCKAVLDAVVESYRDFLGESHKSKSQEVWELIDQARSQVMTHLGEVEAEYTQFRQDTPLLFHGETKATNVHRERMNEIEQARAKILILLTERRSELQSIQDALAQGGSRDALALMLQTVKPDKRSSDLGIRSPASEIFELMMEEQLMLQDLGTDHPKVRNLQKRIALKQEFYMSQMPEDERNGRTKKADFVTVCVDAFRHEIASIESKLMELDELFETERHSSKSISIYEAKNVNFQKELERTETLYQLIMKRLDELNLLQDYGGYKLSVISPAEIGEYVAPVLLQVILIGSVLGTAIGFALSYLAEVNDRTFRSPEEVSEHLGLPIVGHIPVIERGSTIDRGNSQLDKILITHFKPKSRMSESYRAIRTSLYFSTRGEQHKVIQITSPNPGDGKTTLSANLAVSIAQSGKKVLLIDADFRRPRLHELFALDKSIGMSSVISGIAELPDAIQATEVENLWGLPCGPRPNNPCELLTSRRFEELLDILREQYDFVLIDTPPLLSVTDPSAVAARVDGILLTIRLSKRTRGEALKATELLAMLGGNPLGVVVNGIGSKSGYGYGYGYGRYSGYGGYEYRYSTKTSYDNQDDNPYYTEDEDDEGGGAAVARGRKRNARRET